MTLTVTEILKLACAINVEGQPLQKNETHKFLHENQSSKAFGDLQAKLRNFARFVFLLNQPDFSKPILQVFLIEKFDNNNSGNLVL